MEPPRCGVECNRTITIDSATPSGVYQWESQNWGIGDYPEDCTCTLSVEVAIHLKEFNCDYYPALIILLITSIFTD